MTDLHITLNDIRDNFDQRTILRGNEYYLDGRVMEVKSYKTTSYKLSSPITTIFSKVSGSYNYEQKIVMPNADNSEVEGECTCPMGYNCKHVVAVLFQIMSEHRPSPKVREHKDIVDVQAQKWLHKFIAINKDTVSSQKEQQEYFLIYRLFEHRFNYDKSDIEFYRAMTLKSGNLSKGNILKRDNFFNDYKRKEYLDDADRDIIGSLSSIMGHYRYSRTIEFEGEYGASLLKRLVATNKCYFQSSSKALVFIETKKILTFSWREGNTKSKLVSNLTPDEYLISKTSPALCINSVENLIYEIESEYNRETLDFMVNAPELPNKSLVNLTQRVLEELPNVNFPLPSKFELEELKTTPKPHLYIYGQKNLNKTMHLMELGFLYDTHKIASYTQGSTAIQNRENQTVKIIRDIEKEQEYRGVIEEAGFAFEPQVSAYLSFANPSMQVAIERWRHFTEEQAPQLRERGWEIEIANNFNYKFEYMETITVESSESGDTNPWFELSFSVDIGGRTVALLPIVASLLQEFDSVDELPEKLNLELEEGNFLHINAKDIRPILQTIFELFDKKEGDNLIIKPFDAHLLDIDEDADIVWKGAKELKALSQKLKDFKGIEQVPPSPNLQAELREYQQFGLDWLNFLHEFNFSGILADDMGLGKTVQTLAFLQLLKHRGELNKPSLIVMPTSLIGNWKNEIKKFTPDLTFLELYGVDRAKQFEQMEQFDIILTTYQLAQRDEEKYQKKKFLYIILDEAQKIKNPKTKMAVAIKSFNSQYKLALSGTPIENHLGELWSILDFLMGGFLDNLKTFKSFYQNPIEQEYDLKRRELLNKKIAPFILRRTKEEVVKELPPKTEIIKRAKFSKKQAKLYENIRVTMEKKVREAIKGKGLSRSHITILDALLKLRQVCCHPQLLKLESAKSIKESAKLEMFLELIDDLNLEGRKVLVFSQFTSMLSIIEAEIKKRKIAYTKLTGSTRKREEAIKISSIYFDLFIISTLYNILIQRNNLFNFLKKRSCFNQL
ncbi:DEAD/DEAH box helicase family protein [Sulfurovum sp. bin170]|uniref:DEAD/DEAH box helicase n=1 Tax=Sulfurovum sp. bin170 TaxID=2695268 RepID=UPI0013DF7A43|nr:DEAD/DEAH box helicase [Sulfurovum sp. bin170]NEW60660.1 DEAD/DEAH box helicase family protein [Sulfurovum sp. bin170]